MAAPRRIEPELEEDMDDEERAMIDALIASREETVHQQRQVIEMQKEKIRLLHQLLDRREAALSESTKNEEVVEELRRELAQLQSMNQRLAERQAQQEDILDDERAEWGVGSEAATDADDCKMAATDCEDRPIKKRGPKCNSWSLCG